MNFYDVIIVGGGASGCMCALTAKNVNFLMIDPASPGKKLLVTGNGRCNLTNNAIFPSKDFYNADIDAYLSRFSNKDTLAFFNKIGLVTYSDSEGRVYPLSNSAKSVIDVIQNALDKFENFQYLNDFVKKIEKKGENFVIFTQNDCFECKKLVIAAGGKTNLLDAFSLEISPFCESLVALKTQSTHSLNGIRISPVTVKINDREKFTGEVLFKESGLSGICIFNLSAFFARKKEFKGKVFIDLLPTFNENELKNLLLMRRTLGLPINKFFDGIFLPQVAYQILNRCRLDENRLCSDLHDGEIDLMVKVIKNFDFDVKSCYQNNQVFSGGVKLKCLTPNLESKNCKNLFFCGEVCDVDGICGGYNLQWAWTSGHIVGEAL